MAEAAALAGLRRQSEARRLIKAIEDIDPRYLERSAADLLRRRFEPELASKLVRTLRTRAQE